MKTVFITGVNRGLGKELFEQFITKGYYVYGLTRNEEDFLRLEKTKAKNASLLLADISTDACITKIQDRVQDRPVDLIINNAGIPGSESKLQNIQPEELLNLFNVHCVGALRVVKALRNNMLSADKATVLNISSRLGSIHRQNQGTYKNLEVSYSYRIAKAAQNMLSNCLQREFEKITVVSLMPGKLMTAISQTDADLLPSESAKRIIEQWEKEGFKRVNGIVGIARNNN